MYHFIMGQRQNKIFAKGIHQRECNLVMVPLTVYWVKTYITKYIVHPAHIPFVIKAHAPHVGWLGNIWPRSGFLSNHQCLRIIFKHCLIQLVKEIYCLQVSVTTIFVWHPVPILAAIIQIKHISNCIYP